MNDAAKSEAAAHEPWHSRVPARTMAIWLALIAVVFLTRGRWEAWVVEWELGRVKFDFSSAVSDERLVLVGPGGVEILDVRTGASISKFGRGVWAKPCLKGERIVVTEKTSWPRSDTVATLVSAETGRRLSRLGQGYSGWAFSPDGELIAAVSREGEACVWDANYGAVFLVLRDLIGGIDYPRFSRDGATIIARYSDASFGFLDARTGKSLPPPVENAEELAAVSYSPSGRHVVARFEATLEHGLWSAESRKRVRAVPPFAGFAWSPDGRRLAAANFSRSAIDVWDVETGSRAARFAGATDDPVCFSPDGRCVLTLGPRPLRGRILSAWDTDSGRRRYAVRVGQVLKFLPAKDRMYAEDVAGPGAAILDSETGRSLFSFQSAERGILVGSDGALVTDRGGVTRMWRRLRPEWWWGTIYLRHFWLIAAMCLALAASIWRDVAVTRRERAQTSASSVEPRRRD